MIMTTKYKYRNLGAACALAAVLGLTGQVAHAVVSLPVMSTSGGDAAAAPESQAFPSFMFTFDTDYDLAGFEVKFFFDQTKLSFNAAASTLAVAGTAGTMPATPIPVVLSTLHAASNDFQYSYGPADVHDTGFNFSFNAAYVNPQNFSTIAAGTTVTLTGVFDLLSPFKAGQTEQVRVFGDAFDAGSFEPFSVTANVTAVPEPETWLMLLGGLGLLASRLRRRKR